MRIAYLGLVEQISVGVRSQQAFECGNSAHAWKYLLFVAQHFDKGRIGVEQSMQHKKETRQVSGRDGLETAVKDLAEVVRSLHQLLQSYGPAWYTGETDARLRNALAEADSALRSCIVQRGRYRNPRREGEKKLRKPVKKDSYPSSVARKVYHVPASSISQLA
jgi:hypothetical protein